VTSWKRCGGIFDVAARREELHALDLKAAEPGFWDDQNSAQEVISKANAHRAVLEPYDEMVSKLEDAEVMMELLEMEEDASQAELARKDLESQVHTVKTLFDKMEMKSLLGEKFDGNNAYLTINAGAGGTESCDWASMLQRLYHRFAEREGYSVQVLDSQEGEEAGIKSVSMLIEGPYAYGMLKSERGVHRLVRISPFDSASRRHTSFTAVDVVAEIDQSVEVEIIDSDLRVDTFRASGAGGQHVNTTDSAVRITHQPSGIVTQCQSERSQHSNRDKAMKLLKAKLYEWEMDKKRKEVEKFYDPKGAIAWGSQIRSYVLQPYTMVKDHRTDTEVGNAQGVLDGEIHPFIEAYLKQKRASDV
jgi:peptide chain release factor 2